MAEAAALPSEASLPIRVFSIDDLITDSAKREGISRELFYKTLDCESAHFKDVSIQSGVKDPNGPNGRENSWGLAQIDLDYHPEITKEEAQSPEFAIPYAAKLFKQNPYQFHCYKLIK